jgi:trehalose 6-phosphate phosphatase
MRAPSPPIELAEEALHGWRQRGALLLLSDFDGTLTPIVATPGAARLSTGMRRVLARLAARPDAAVAIISGRDLQDVKGRADVPGIIHAGCHGFLVDGPGLSFVHPEAQACRPLLDQVADDLRSHLRPLSGVLVETKTLGVAVHFRHTANSDLAEVFYHVQRARESAGPRLATLNGKKVIEFVPSAAWHKGECALWIRDRLEQELPGEPLAVYLGDDETDERAFQALRGKALTVRVGSGHRGSAAARWVRDPNDVRELLSRLADGAETR